MKALNVVRRIRPRKIRFYIHEHMINSAGNTIRYVPTQNSEKATYASESFIESQLLDPSHGAKLIYIRSNPALN